MHNGCILCGSVGSGKSLTSLAYYIIKECGGKLNGGKMRTPKDLYIITTAKKRDSYEWDLECSKVYLCMDREDDTINEVCYHVDSWNNIKKYKKVVGAFFIFDEQRVVGSGAWVKAFLEISRKNHWVLLSATPGDTWSDYIPVFVANGFYKNKTEFNAKHCVYSRVTKFPKIDRYIGTKELENNLKKVLVKMKDQRITVRHEYQCICSYDKVTYKTVMKLRWDPYDDCPIKETGKLFYLLRRVVNEDDSRLVELDKILDMFDRVIVFYNFDYELEMLREFLSKSFITWSEWNGHIHEAIPTNDHWVYLVQYSAGCEGWNCTETNCIVFFSQNYSYRVTEQAAGRIDRIDTKYKDLYYYYFRSEAPIDRAIREALRNKRTFNERRFLNDV